MDCPHFVCHLARTMVIASGYLETIPSHSPELAALHQFTQRYLSRYQLSGRVTADKYRDWIPIVAAARLSDGIEEQREWLMAQVRSVLVELPQ